jgi:hypothetical protein
MTIFSSNIDDLCELTRLQKGTHLFAHRGGKANEQAVITPYFSVVRFRAASAKTNNDRKKRSALPQALIASDTQPRKSWY